MMTVEMASEIFGLPVEKLNEASAAVKELLGEDVKWAAPEVETPHLFVMVFIDRIGRKDVPWLHLGGSLSSPWNLKDNGLAVESKFRNALKTNGRAAFLRLPIYMLNPGFRDDSILNTISGMLNSLDEASARLFFNTIRHKDAVVSDTSTPTPPETTSAAMAESDEKPAKKGGRRKGEPKAPREPKAPKEKAPREPKAPKEKAPREPRASKENLSPRVQKWVEGRVKDMASYITDIAIPHQYGIAKKWHELKKANADIDAAVSEMRVLLTKRAETPAK